MHHSGEDAGDTKSSSGAGLRCPLCGHWLGHMTRGRRARLLSMIGLWIVALLRITAPLFLPNLLRLTVKLLTQSVG